MHQKPFIYRILLGFLLATVLVVGGSITQPTAAAVADTAANTIVVNSTLDFVFPDASCTLREAIYAANNNTPYNGCLGGSAFTADLIVFAADGTITLNAAYGSLQIESAMTIEGNGRDATIIDGDLSEQIMIIDNNGLPVTLRSMTLQHGVADELDLGGGAILNGSGDLTLDDVVVANNVASSLWIAGGGGIATLGPLTIINSEIRDNSALSGSEGGGGIMAHDATLIIQDSIISGNTDFYADYGGGGGIYAYGGTLTLSDVVLENNASIQSPIGGGGLLAYGNVNTPAITIVDSVFRGNQATLDGQVAEGGGAYITGDLVVENTTFDGNSADRGGGLYGVAGLDGGWTISRSTFSRNSAETSGGGLYMYAGGLIVENSTFSQNTASYGAAVSAASMELRATTVAYNTSSAADGEGLRTSGNLLLHNALVAYNEPVDCDVNGVTSGDHNLASDPSCGLSAASDIVLSQYDPQLLGPLQGNGGPTETHALYAGSVAVDAGSCNDAPPTDQRSVGRPQGATCDIGAYEYERGDNRVFLSTGAADSARGLSWTAADIVVYEQEFDAWSLLFNGAHYVPGANIDAFLFYRGNDIVMSFADPTAVPGIGLIDDSDLVIFDPDSGTFQWVFDGSDVGLTTDDEDVDAIAVIGGRLAVSTIGAFDVPGVSGDDEDFIRLLNPSFGPNTSGTWRFYFDGSDVGLGASERADVDGAWFDNGASALYFSTVGSVTVNGVPLLSNDIAVCDITASGSNTACDLTTFGVYWSGSDAGLSTNVVAVQLALNGGQTTPTLDGLHAQP